MDFIALAQQCAPGVATPTMLSIVSVESGGNAYAIGVVGGHLVRQPRTLLEGIATAENLVRQGIRFSAGVGQIYVGNWERLGLDTQSVFDPCANLRAAASILSACYSRALQGSNSEQRALRAAFSCYYSNNFTTGFAEGYVDKVVAAARRYVGPQAPQHQADKGQLHFKEQSE